MLRLFEALCNGILPFFQQSFHEETVIQIEENQGEDDAQQGIANPHEDSGLQIVQADGHHKRTEAVDHGLVLVFRTDAQAEAADGTKEGIESGRDNLIDQIEGEGSDDGSYQTIGEFLVNIVFYVVIREQGTAGKTDPHELAGTQPGEQTQNQSDTQRQTQLPLEQLVVQINLFQKRKQPDLPVLIFVVAVEHQTAQGKAQQSHPGPLNEVFTIDRVFTQENKGESQQAAVAHLWLLGCQNQHDQKAQSVDHQFSQEVAVVGQDGTAKQNGKDDKHAKERIFDVVAVADKAYSQQNTEDGNSHGGVSRSKKGAHQGDKQNGEDDNQKRADHRSQLQPADLLFVIGFADHGPDSGRIQLDHIVKTHALYSFHGWSQLQTAAEQQMSKTTNSLFCSKDIIQKTACRSGVPDFHSSVRCIIEQRKSRRLKRAE